MSFSEATGIFIASASVGLIIVLPISLAIIPAIWIRMFDLTKEICGNFYSQIISISLLCALCIIVNCISGYTMVINLMYSYIYYFCLIYLIWLYIVFRQEKQPQPQPQQTENKKDCKILAYLIALFVWAFWPIILLELFFKYRGSLPAELPESFLPVLWLIASYLISGTIINYKGEQEIKLYFFGTFLLFVIFYILTGALIRIPSAAVELLGLGERQVSVLLKKEGCDIFNAVSKSTGEGEICKDNSVDSIYLKSRIASPYVFERHKNNEMLWRITIPKEYVVSLILQKQNSGQSIGSQSSDSSAQNNQLPDSSSPNKTPAQTSPEKCLTTCCMCCVPAASCHIPPNCPSKAKQESESRAQPC